MLVLVLVLVLDILLEQEASDMERHEVSNEEWGILSSVLEAPRMGRGRRLENSRRTFNGVLWILRAGAPWRDLPRRFGPWQTVYHGFNAWRKNGQSAPACRPLLLGSCLGQQGDKLEVSANVRSRETGRLQGGD